LIVFFDATFATEELSCLLSTANQALPSFLQFEFLFTVIALGVRVEDT